MCQNTEGGFTCVCATGFVLSDSTDVCEGRSRFLSYNYNFLDTKSIDLYLWSLLYSFVTFTDIHECSLATRCGSPALGHTCLNTDGGYICQCADGFSVDSVTGICAG